jgi:hypothetical protein
VPGVRVVVGPGGERARHDDRGVDAEPGQLGGVADGQGVLGRLGREVGGEIGRGAAAATARADPDQQPVALSAQVGQGRPVDALGGQDVDVVDVGDMLHREGLGRAEDHVPGVVDDDV